MQTPSPSRRRATTHAPSGPRRLHRLVAALVGLAAAAMLIAPALASADTSSSLTIVGTSDVSDSGLIPNVIQPQFKAAFPGITFKYVGSATGTAIQNAEAGNGGPSVLIVHAASLENQFVAGGFSLNNQFGNAIFTNDFVLAGPTADATAANVAATAPNNIAQAFANVAAAGVANTATFESRGGTTTASGTTVEEHSIWQLVNSSGLTPAGVVLCTVSAGDGGGMSPINPTVQTTSGQPCPDNGTVIGDAPPWYVVNNVNQSASVIAANACTFANQPANSCYALTDRGTFDYLTSQTSTSASGLIPNLQIVTRNNSASAPGGQNELINYFHAYIINPSVPGETVNLPAAQDFINFITSPSLQSQLSTYLSTTSDPAGAPFVADASPAITQTGLPSTVLAGNSVTVTGTVTNREPGFPALAGKPVAIDELAGTVAVPVASGTTDANGNYSITFKPGSSGSYQASTGLISQVENTTLNPVYGDILSPAAATPVALTVQGTISLVTARPSVGSVSVSGNVGPPAPDKNAKIDILARPRSSKGAFTQIGGGTLSAGQTSYAFNGALKTGKWTVETTYSDNGELQSATSSTKNVTVPNATTAVSFKKLTAKKGALTVSGTLSQAPSAKGARVELLVLRIGKVSITGANKKPTKKGQVHKSLVVAGIAAASFRQVAKANLRTGKTTFTIKAKSKRGQELAVQLVYVDKGQPTTYSRVRTIAIH